MAENLSCLQSICLDQGSWADWVSGTASFLAVVAAAGGFWLTKAFRDADREAADADRESAQRDAEARRALARREADVNTAQLAGVKLFRLMNGCHDLHRHLWAEHEGPELIGVDADKLWRRTHPLIGLQIEPALNLDAQEIGLLVRIEEMDFMSEMMLALGRYQSIVLSLQEYERQYLSIQKMTPPPERMEGRIGIHALSREQVMAIQPYSVALEHLLLSIRDMVEENVEKLDALAKGFHPMMKRHYPDDRFVALVPPPNPGGPRG